LFPLFLPCAWAVVNHHSPALSHFDTVRVLDQHRICHAEEQACADHAGNGAQLLLQRGRVGQGLDVDIEGSLLPLAAWQSHQVLNRKRQFLVYLGQTVSAMRQRRRSELPTTDSELRLMAAAAHMGSSSPSAAAGIATAL
jgi:hypothetical protein